MHNSLQNIIIPNINQNDEDTENTPPTKEEECLFEPYPNPFNILTNRCKPSCVCTFVIVRRIRLLN